MPALLETGSREHELFRRCTTLELQRVAVTRRHIPRREVSASTNELRRRELDVTRGVGAWLKRETVRCRARSPRGSGHSKAIAIGNPR